MAVCLCLRAQAPAQHRHTAVITQLATQRDYFPLGISFRLKQPRRAQAGSLQVRTPGRVRGVSCLRVNHMLTKLSPVGAVVDRDVEAPLAPLVKVVQRSPKRTKTVTHATKRTGGSDSGDDGIEKATVVKPEAEEGLGVLPAWLGGGMVALVMVAFLWGTYTPVLRFVYAIDGTPVT
eukprot:scaffold173094_cov43-Prasinocladus_malaysianus.AAC.2